MVGLRIKYVSGKHSAQCLANSKQSQIMSIVGSIIISKGQMLFLSKILNLILKRMQTISGLLICYNLIQSSLENRIKTTTKNPGRSPLEHRVSPSCF